MPVYRNVLLCICMCVCLVVPSMAAAPVAVIDGPTSRKVGDRFILGSSKSTGDHRKWQVKITPVLTPEDNKANLDRKAIELRKSGLYEVTAIEPEDKLYDEIEGGQSIVLPTYPGLYEITLIVSNVDGIGVAEYSLRIIGSTPPAPPNPDDPDPPTPPPVLSLTQSVAAAVKQVATAETRDEFLRLAESYEKIAALGLDVPNLKQTTDLFTAVTVVKAKAQWQTILASVITPRITASGITQPEQYVAAWKEIAAGIRAGLGAQPPPTPVDPSPIPGDGLRVMIRYEREDFNKLPSSQIAIFTSTEVLQWLMANAVKDGYRIWDKDVDTQFESSIWQDAMKLPYDSLPWISISNGVTSYSGPLPKTIAETITLLQKYKL